MKRFLFGFIALLLAGGLLAACGDDESSSGSGSSGSSSNADFNDADVAFVQGMIPHHEQAVEMAKLADSQAESPEVKDLAMRIEEAQGPEIETMKGFLKDWGKSESGGGDDMGAGDDMGGDDEMSGGMMSDDEMAELEEAEGAEFDELFLTMMTEHHEGAVEMAQTEVDDGKNADAIALAEDIISAQEAEIEEMSGLLEGASS